MGVRRILLPWDSQPQEVVAIDWQKSISQSLVGLYPLSLASGFRDLVSEQVPTVTGSVDLVANAGGVFRSFAGSKYFNYASTPRGLTTTTPVTVAWTQEARGTSGNSTLLNLNVGTAGVDSSFVVYQSSSTSGYYFTAGPRRTNAAQSWSVALGALTNNVRDVFVLTSAGGLGSLTDADWELYKNGALVAKTTTATYGTNTTGGFRVGGLLESTGDPFEGIIGDLHFWSRVLSVQERIEWSRNVNMAYMDRSIWVPVSAGAPASYTLTAAAASYSLTGNAAVMRASRRLSAAAGSFALTGNAAGLYRGLRLTAAAGAYAWTGNSARLLQGRRLLAAAASYTLTGNAATLRAARKLSAAAASYTFTGNAAALTYTPLGSYSLAAAAGSYLLTGNSTGVRASRRLAAAPGIFNLTGTAAQLLRGYRLVAAVQTYVWTGAAATLSRSQAYSLLASTATYGWTGTAAGLIYSGAPAVVRYASRSRIFTTGRELRSILTQRATRSITP